MYRTICRWASLLILGLAMAGCSDIDSFISSAGVDSTVGHEFATVTVQASCADWEEWVHQDFIYQNNVWGKGDITEYVQCILRRGPDGNEQYGWRWQWPRGTGNVKAYPEVIYGHKPWHASSTTASLPVRIASISKLSVHYALEMTAQGTYNLAFDIWVTSTNPPTPETITHEIMIWMDQTFQPQAQEFRVGQVAIDDVTYDLYIRPHFDPAPGTDHGLAAKKPYYIAFVSQVAQYSGVVNVEKILGYLVQHGHIPSDHYMASLELGNEIIAGTGEAWLNRFQIEMD